LLLLLVSFLAGCSLVEIESPAVPLPERDLRARQLTREFALAFATSVAVTANGIMNSAASNEEKISALTWKMSSATGMAITSTQLSPMLSLIDTWAFAAQMDDFLRAPEQAALFGTHREAVLATSGQQLRDIRDIARRVATRSEFSAYSDAVRQHANRYPMTTLNVVRVSMASNPVIDGLPGVPLETVGTGAEAMSDVAGRLRLYTIMLRYSTQWQLELYALQSGLTEGEIHNVLASIDESFGDVASLARNSPMLMARATGDFERALTRSSDSFERSALSIVQSIQEERELLMSDLDENWDRIYLAIDSQRSAAAADIERIALSANEELWDNLRAAIREAAIIVIVFVVLLLTLPFVAGYVVGRARAAGGAR
jgi:hypothetical protein